MEQFKRTYAFLAYTILNCIVAFIVLNVILGFVFYVKDVTQKAPVVDKRVRTYRERFSDSAAYTRTPPAEITALLDEQDAMGTIGLQYEPWVQFRNPHVTGRFLNTDEHGLRATRTPAVREGRALKVYVFGGSTTFGYGVRDEDTIPSYIQKIMEQTRTEQPILVRNFGQGYYYSSQELLSLLSQLKNGDPPDWVVFIDGGNDTAQLGLQHDLPTYTPALERLWALQSGGNLPQQAPSAGLLSKLPVGRLARVIAKTLSLREVGGTSTADVVTYQPINSDAQLPPAERNKMAEYVVSHYLANLKIARAVCHDYNVQCLFVWQPHPSYKYDPALHKTFPFDGPIAEYRTMVFSRLEKHQAPDYLFLGDLLEHRTKKSYVDDVHYNEEINEQIADRIVQFIARQDSK